MCVRPAPRANTVIHRGIFAYPRVSRGYGPQPCLGFRPWGSPGARPPLRIRRVHLAGALQAAISPSSSGRVQGPFVGAASAAAAAAFSSGAFGPVRPPSFGRFASSPLSVSSPARPSDAVSAAAVIEQSLQAGESKSSGDGAGESVVSSDSISQCSDLRWMRECVGSFFF